MIEMQVVWVLFRKLSKHFCLLNSIWADDESTVQCIYYEFEFCLHLFHTLPNLFGLLNHFLLNSLFNLTQYSNISAIYKALTLILKLVSHHFLRQLTLLELLVVHFVVLLLRFLSLSQLSLCQNRLLFLSVLINVWLWDTDWRLFVLNLSYWCPLENQVVV